MPLENETLSLETLSAAWGMIYENESRLRQAISHEVDAELMEIVQAARFEVEEKETLTRSRFERILTSDA
jgi:hypothetical protein